MRVLKNISLLILSVFILSCQSKVNKEDLHKINGYWGIQQVEMSTGEDKDYKVNETIDFFQLENDKGFRQKVMPQLDGTYKTNGIKETILILEKNEKYFIEYKTAYGRWKEEILGIKDSLLVLKNNQNTIYTYKRFQPFSLK